MSDPAEPPPSGPTAAAGKVKAPAVSLIVFNALSLVYALLCYPALGAIRDLLAEEGKRDADALTALKFWGGPWMEWSLAVCAVLSIAGLLGGAQMLRLRGYGLAMAGVVATLVNLASCCCLVNIGLGIWALVVLLDDDVRNAFRRT
jgi:hypothetical protein